MGVAAGALGVADLAKVEAWLREYLAKMGTSEEEAPRCSVRPCCTGENTDIQTAERLKGLRMTQGIPVLPITFPSSR